MPNSTDARAPYNGGIHVLSQVLGYVAIIPGVPFYVRLVISSIVCYLIFQLVSSTTGNFVTDMALGSTVLTQLMSTLDYSLLTGPEALRDNHWQGKGNINEQSLKHRLRWALNLYTNPRGIGWNHEPLHLPTRPRSSTSRSRFVLSRLLKAVLCVATEFVCTVVNASNPGMSSSNTPLSEAHFFWRTLGSAGYGIAGFARINAMNCVISAIVVGLGYSKPERWPNLFGNPSEIWSIQRLWRRGWHQLLRKSVIAFTHFIVVKIFRCRLERPLPISTKLLRLYTAFFIVGAVHVGGEYMMLGRLGWGVFNFFALQAVGITIETLVQYMWASTQSNGKTASSTQVDGVSETFKSASPLPHPNGPALWTKLVGYAWVIIWLSWTMPFMIDPMVSTGFFHNPALDLRTENVTSWIRL